MICRNAKQMLQTALRNAIPMTSQGYTYEASRYLPDVFYVTHPTNRDEEGNTLVYNVCTRVNQCNCPFHMENRHVFFGVETTCKHIEWVRAQEEAEAAQIAEYEAIEEAKADEAAYRIEATARRAYELSPCFIGAAA